MKPADALYGVTVDENVVRLGAILEEVSAAYREAARTPCRKSVRRLSAETARFASRLRRLIDDVPDSDGSSADAK
jgi:hypothetical protein